MARNKYSETGGAPTHKKGRVAEARVVEMLRARGFDAELSAKLKGPDAYIRVGKSLLSVEVKSAVRYIRHGKYEFWLTEKVLPTRRGDDFIGIVTPDGRVFMETMGRHLLFCRKDGRRNITKLVKEIEAA